MSMNTLIIMYESLNTSAEYIPLHGSNAAKAKASQVHTCKFTLEITERSEVIYEISIWARK